MNFSFRRPLLAATCALTLGCAAFTPYQSFAQKAAPFHVDSTWKLGGDGSWDYMTVDPAAHPLPRMAAGTAARVATGRRTVPASGAARALRDQRRR